MRLIEKECPSSGVGGGYQVSASLRPGEKKIASIENEQFNGDSGIFISS